MNNQVFRKVSIERLSSPEQLDTLMKVTSPRSWLALTAIGLLIVTAVLWGYFGTLSTKLTGGGVLIKPGGLQSIYASSGGRISDISVVENTFVRKGDVIARVEQPALLQQLMDVSQKISALHESAGSNPDAAAQAKELEKLLDKMRTDYANATRVVSPYAGRLVEVKVKKDGQVAPGLPIVTIEPTSDNVQGLETILYVPAEKGKQVIPGMEVQITPSTVNKQETGFMVGRVVSVSEFPASRQGMMVTLGNEALVESLSLGGAALEVHVDLILDSSTASGYKWSSNQGTSVKVDSGTLVTGEVILKKERPITSVIPQIK